VIIGTKTEQYNSTTGVLSNLTMPDDLQYQGITHDAEAENTGFTVGAPPGFKSSGSTVVTGVRYGYDIRGEFYQTQATGYGPILGNGYVTLSQSQFIFGHLECLSQLAEGNTGGCDGSGGNNRPGDNLGIDGNTGGGGYGPPGIDPNSCPYSETVSYDSNGRQASNIVTVRSNGQCIAKSYVADTRSYDAEKSYHDRRMRDDIFMDLRKQY
jgi:hypothetical protein